MRRTFNWIWGLNFQLNWTELFCSVPGSNQKVIMSAQASLQGWVRGSVYNKVNSSNWRKNQTVSCFKFNPFDKAVCICHFFCIHKVFWRDTKENKNIFAGRRDKWKRPPHCSIFIVPCYLSRSLNILYLVSLLQFRCKTTAQARIL